MKKTHVFESYDGTRFSTRTECKSYEEGKALELLCHLKPSDIDDALDRANVPLADAFERVGNIIGDKRRGGGELRRKKASPATTTDIKENMKDLS